MRPLSILLLVLILAAAPAFPQQDAPRRVNDIVETRDDATFDFPRIAKNPAVPKLHERKPVTNAPCSGCCCSQCNNSPEEPYCSASPFKNCYLFGSEPCDCTECVCW